MHVKPLVASLLLLPLLLSGCSKGASASSPSSPTPTPSPSASPTPPPVPTTDPLTGLSKVSGPVVAVKVDNGVLARPYQRGLKQAAVIYQELVEGGATRFMAIFESASATGEVGPIRSARETDLSILRAYGEPSLAFSGAQPAVMSIVRAEDRRGHVVDASYDTAPGLYRLGERRRDARNFFAVPAKVGERRGGSEPRDIGWRFGPVAGAGVATASARAVYSPYTTMKLRYQATTGTWVVSEKSHVVPFNPANVVIQYVTVKRSRFHDVNGMNSPLTITTGSGKVVVMRDGKRFAGTWKRSGHGVTRFLDAAGRHIKLKAGPTFVLLLPKTGTVAYG